MKKYQKSFLSVCLSVALAAVGSSLPALASEYARGTEAESAVAGIAVNLNNYEASSYTPEEDILEYLAPFMTEEDEAKEASSEEAVSFANDSENDLLSGQMFSETAVEDAAAVRPTTEWGMEIEEEKIEELESYEASQKEIFEASSAEENGPASLENQASDLTENASPAETDEADETKPEESEAQTLETAAAGETSGQESTSEYMDGTEDAEANETTAVSETFPAVSEASSSNETEASSELTVIIPTAAVPSVVGIESFYQGGTKTEGESISYDELFIRADYSDGTSQYLYSDFYAPIVGTTLAAGSAVVTVYYEDYSSSFEIPVNSAPTAAPAVVETTAAATDYRSAVVAYALSWVGMCSYVWGGENLTVGGGVDCSGFTMCVYRTIAGIELPHYSYAQWNYGTAITYDQLRPGDLVLYEGHVAIYIGNGQIVHAKSATAGIVTDSVYFSAAKPPVGFRSLLP